MFRTLLTQLVTHERIKTTTAKANFLVPTADRLIAKAKRVVFKGENQHKPEVYKILRTQEARDKLFNEIVPRLEHRDGCFTNTKFLRRRKGDNAPVSYIQIWGK